MQNSQGQNVQASTRRIHECGIVGIVRGNFSSAEVLAGAETLLAEKIDIIEVTLNSKAALDLIAMLRSRFDKKMLVGAGTVRNREQYIQARKAGAEFTVAPNLDEATVRAAMEDDLLHLPGVLTPTEIQKAADCGCRFVKLFPMDAMGPKYLSAIRAPLDDMQFLPTGGVSLENIQAYRNAGAAAVGIGGSLVRAQAYSGSELAARAAAFRKAWDSAITV